MVHQIVRDNALRFAVYGPVFVLWEVVARGAARPESAPRPLGIVQQLFDRVSDGVLQTAVYQSLSRILMAVAIALVVGLILGAAMAWWRDVDRALSPIIDALRSITPIAWIPMAILWFEITGGATVFIVAYAAVFPVALNTMQVVRTMDVRLIRAARTLGASPIFLFRRVVLRDALPTVIVGARICMGFAWASIIAAELALGIKLDTGTEVAVA